MRVLLVKRVVEYLCTNPDCKSGSSWHPFDTETMALEELGEYTVTLRVREIKTKDARSRRLFRPKVGSTVRITGYLAENGRVLMGMRATVDRVDARRGWVWLRVGKSVLPAVSIRNVERGS